METNELDLHNNKVAELKKYAVAVAGHDIEFLYHAGPYGIDSHVM